MTEQENHNNSYFLSHSEVLSVHALMPPLNGKTAGVNIIKVFTGMAEAGNTNLRERLSTVDLLIKLACN